MGALGLFFRFEAFLTDSTRFSKILTGQSRGLGSDELPYGLGTLVGLKANDLHQISSE